MTKTHAGTTSTYIFFTCVCGHQHRVTQYGLRVAACGAGLVLVTAGSSR